MPDADQPRSRKVKQFSQYLTPTQIAGQLQVSPDRVKGWIRRAELGAVNVGDGFRSRYRVSRESLAVFLKGREVQPSPPPVRRRRRSPEKLIEYF